MIEELTNKKVLFVFSDPAGAKALLAFISLNCHCFKDYKILSNKIYDFYGLFELEVGNSSIKPAEEWINSFEPEIVFTGTSFPEEIELSFIEAAHKKKIFSISFVDHWINFSLRFKKDEKFIYPDIICIIDDEAFQIAIKDGIPAEKLRIFVNPYYGYLRLWKPAVVRDVVLKQLKLPPNSHYLLYAPEPISLFGLREKYGFDELDGLKELRAALADQKIKIVVKHHPKQNKLIYHDLMGTFEFFEVDEKETDINLVIYYSDAVIGFFSNILIEAIILGKDVVRPLIGMKNPLDDSLKNKNIGKVISNKGEYKRIIKNYGL